MSQEERQKVKSEYMSKKGFITFSIGWENQHTLKEKMFYTFWYTRQKDETLKNIEDLALVEHDELAKAMTRNRDIQQGNGRPAISPK